MKIKLKDKKNNKIQLVIEDTEAGFLNMIRRACSFQVPTLAIEEVYFSKNDSALYDEQIALRLGLIPLKTGDLGALKMPADCTCKGKGCTKCQIKLKLNSEGPKTVYAGEFNSDLVVHKDMPIVLLLHGQKLEFVAVAQLGTGEIHAKWNPGLAFYQHYPKIKVSKGAEAKNGIKACPRGVFEGENIVHLEECNLCEGCVKPSEGAISVEAVPNKFIFTFESWGQLEPLEVLKEAAKVVKERVGELKI